MVSERVCHQTWDELRGELILLRWPASNPGAWELRQMRARWTWDTLGLAEGSRVVDVGCGNGLVALCLARLGAQVTAIDRLASVLAHAHAQAGDAPITYQCADLRHVDYPAGSSDAAVCFEVAGLMSPADDAALIGRIARWLRPGGWAAIDCAQPPLDTHRVVSCEVGGGELTLETRYDPDTRLLHIDPTFRDGQGVVIRLSDEYDPCKPAHTGVRRYLYAESELREMMCAAGLQVQSLPHYQDPDSHYLLLGRA